MNQEISKRLFWRFLNKKTKKIIHHYHIFSVMSILFDEIVKDLLKNKKIKIFNFGTLFLDKKNPKKYYDVRYQKIMISKGSRLLKLLLVKKLRSKLINLLDVDASLGND